MKHIIEFKLHAGQFPYFVADILGGVDFNGKKYGISLDTEHSYLPDSVRILTPAELEEIVLNVPLMAHDTEDNLRTSQSRPMSPAEKTAFVSDFLARHDL